jgi:hypothetical protein
MQVRMEALRYCEALITKNQTVGNDGGNNKPQGLQK